MRFNLRGVLIVFVYVAVGSAALVNVTPAWASAVVTLTAATLLIAAAFGISGTAVKRSFWGSFSLVGFLYLALIYAPGVSENVAPHLATTKLLTWAAEQRFDEYDTRPLATTTQSSLIVQSLSTSGSGSGMLRFTPAPPAGVQVTGMFGSSSFLLAAIGQPLWALALGLLAALVAAECARRGSAQAAFNQVPASQGETAVSQ